MRTSFTVHGTYSLGLRLRFTSSHWLVTKLNTIDILAHRLMLMVPFDAEHEVKCGYIRNAIEERRMLTRLNLFPRIAANNHHPLNPRIPAFSRRRYILPFSRTTKRFNSFSPKLLLLLLPAYIMILINL